MKKLWYLMIMLFLCSSMWAQTKTITGHVKEKGSNEALIGVNVFVRGTTIGVVTDLNGDFNLEVPNDATHLTFSFIGMQTIEVAIADQTVINVIMISDSQNVDEVVVVAYGTTTKEAFTGSAGVVKADVLEKRQVTNATQSLAGEVAGIQIVNSTGQPGSEPSVRIRGIGSMSASNKPLYVVDGVPYDGSISAINPSDIKSLTVLKDAAASAIYGARGANGVILVTTKKGKRGEAKVTFNAKVGHNSRAVPNYEVMDDPAMYYETFYQAMFNSKALSGESAAIAHEYALNNMLDIDAGGLGYQVYTVPEGQDFIGSNGKLNPKCNTWTEAR